ncbi:Ribosome quality control complex subunit 2 [Spathaspora sp. JA1]|nr:Ribosome quality control complex subunit 2 [Spathaspora sp. JA1]
MKQRITGLDLQILTSELTNELLNYRLQNIYNASSSSRQYLFKFSIPDSKKVVVLEYGNRIHLTEFERPTTQQPSDFVSKLRKHLKEKRLTGIKQISNDRVLVFQFSNGLYYLVMEFFSAGNILLLDENRKILSLQRLVSAKEDVDRYAVREEYKMFNESLFSQEFQYEKKIYSSKDITDWIDIHKSKITENSDSKKGKVYSIHKLAFINASHLSSELIQKVLHENSIDPSQSCLKFESDQQLAESVANALTACEESYLSLLDSKSENIGYIVARRNKSSDANSSLEFIYDEFHPFKPYKAKEEDYQFTQVSGYNKTLDKFFSTLESSKFELKVEQLKQTAVKRLDKAKSERDKQIQSLAQQQDLNAKKGELIQYHADLVDDCRACIQQFLDQSMDWTNIETVLGLEKKKGNKLAQVIGLPLNLKENKIKILLADFDDQELDEASETDSDTDTESESDSGSESVDEDFPKRASSKKSTNKKEKKQNIVPTWIDLSLTSFANARSYFDTKKTAATKQEKVEKNTKIALKNAERKITHDLSKNLKQENDSLKQMRPKYWFEKFYWFVTNEGYLCLAGRDNSQIDMIYYRHFSDNDYFVSSDLEGSLKVFVKNPFKGEPVPPSSIMQAGIFAMSASSGWNGKVTTSAWVLHGDQISKRDYDGSLISSGEFRYTSKKEYLPPAQLVMGFGLYGLVDEESTKRYADTRVSREQEHGLKVVVDNKKRELDMLKGSKEATPARESSIEAVKELEEDTQAAEAVSSEEISEVTESDLESITASDTQEVKKNSQLARGKRSKLKKIAAKYADQDEEERRLRMDALGTLKQVEQKEQQPQKEILEKIEATKRVQEMQAARERKKKQDEKEYQKYLNDEADSDESHITNYLEILDSLVSKPSTKDEIINMVPVFAPWASLQKFKYKVKIQPGAGKKGKCIGDSLNYFTTRKMDPSSTDTDLDWPKERELVKGLKPNDLVGVFTVAKVKLVLPGGSDNAKKKGGKKK